MRALITLTEMLGRQARWALPAGVLIGIALPQLASLLRPGLTAAVIGTLTLTLIRLNWSDLLSTFYKPVLPLAMAAWQLVITPLLVFSIAGLLHVPADLTIALTLQCASAPVGSAAAFALFVGINGERVMLLTVLTTVLLPITLTSLVAWVLIGSSVQIDLLTFFARVSFMVATPFALAAIIRRICGAKRLQSNKTLLAGLNVIALVIFAIAVMDGVTAYLLASPMGALGLIVLAFGMSIIMHLAGYLAFVTFGREQAWVSALASGNRNMGLILAITAGTAGQTTSLYFGLAQIPMYCVPLILGPLVARGSANRTTR